MSPYKCFGSILGRTVGPFIAIGGIFASNNGLMHGYREISERTVGPFRIISRIFGSNNGPIPEYRQHLSEELLELFVTISSSFSSKMGLCECFGSISGRTVGPFIAISGIFGSNNRLMQVYREHLSESSRTISRIFGRNDGPILGYRQHLPGEVVGLFVSISGFIRQQRWAHMSASAASLDEQRAHALPSVVFFASNNGPIQVQYTGSISEQTAGPSRTTSRIFGSNDGPIQVLLQHLGRSSGPMQGYGGHLRKNRGPIHDHRYHFLAAVQVSSVGPYDPIGGFHA